MSADFGPLVRPTAFPPKTEWPGLHVVILGFLAGHIVGALFALPFAIPLALAWLLWNTLT